MFKVKNKDISFEYISHLVLVFLLLTLNMQLQAGREYRRVRENSQNIFIFSAYHEISYLFLLFLSGGNTIGWSFFIQFSGNLFILLVWPLQNSLKTFFFLDFHFCVYSSDRIKYNPPFFFGFIIFLTLPSSIYILG